MYVVGVAYCSCNWYKVQQLNIIKHENNVYLLFSFGFS